MSSTTPGAGSLNFDEQNVRIQRMCEEAAKFAAEREKLMTESLKLHVEQQKFYAEQLKLSAEAAKLDRDRITAPWLVFAAVVGGVVTLGTLLLRALGVLS